MVFGEVMLSLFGRGEVAGEVEGLGGFVCAGGDVGGNGGADGGQLGKLDDGEAELAPVVSQRKPARLKLDGGGGVGYAGEGGFLAASKASHLPSSLRAARVVLPTPALTPQRVRICRERNWSREVTRRSASGERRERGGRRRAVWSRR